MYLLNATLPTPEENLALDEALVEVADRISLMESSLENSSNDFAEKNEVLRLWELATPCVVLGRSSKWAEEVNLVACDRERVPVLRRVSGGASIVAGPGCLMYSVLISYQQRPTWRSLDIAHREVMTRIQAAVQHVTDSFQLSLQIDIDGTCDLTIANRKFSGNALRCKRYWMLYHGTIMYSMPLAWLTDYLREPSRQPEYRKKREHDSFVTNVLNSSSRISPTEFRGRLERQLAATWNASEPWQSCPWKGVVDKEAKQLLHSRYSNQLWHRCR